MGFSMGLCMCLTRVIWGYLVFSRIILVIKYSPIFFNFRYLIISIIILIFLTI